MISASVSMAAIPCARAIASMSFGILVSFVIMQMKLAIWTERINSLVRRCANNKET